MNQEDFIDKMIELRDWGVLSQMLQFLPEDFIMEHKYEFLWGTISDNIDRLNIPDWIFYTFAEFLDWKIISSKRLDERFIHKHKDRLNWNELLRHNQFSMPFIYEHLHYIDLNQLTSTQELSEDFLLEFKDVINWDTVRYRRDLSVEFLRKAADYINWKYYLWNGRLTEEHLREFNDYLDWGEVSERQTMSKDFILENWDKINFKTMIMYNTHLCLNHEFIKEIVKEKLDRATIRDGAENIRHVYGSEFYNELITMKNEQENFITR